MVRKSKNHPVLILGILSGRATVQCQRTLCRYKERSRTWNVITTCQHMHICDRALPFPWTVSIAVSTALSHLSMKRFMSGVTSAALEMQCAILSDSLRSSRASPRVQASLAFYTYFYLFIAPFPHPPCKVIPFLAFSLPLSARSFLTKVHFLSRVSFLARSRLTPTMLHNACRAVNHCGSEAPGADWKLLSTYP